MKSIVGAADSGNSCTKWAEFRNGLLADYGTWPDLDANINGVASNIRHWKLAGVHPERLLAVKKALESHGKTCEVLSNPTSFGLNLDLEHPDKVGVDRVAAAWGAWLRTGKGRGCVVVDAGTAVTIDYVDESGTFRGGAILPGLDLMLKSLADGTRLLPRLFPADVSSQTSWPGRSTRKAIAAGVLAAQTGAVMALISMARNKNPDIQVFLTGGGGELIGKAMSTQFEFVPTLVLEGIAKAGETAP